MRPIFLQLSATLLLVALSNGVLANSCYVIGDTSKNNLSKPQGSAQNPYGSLAAVQADVACDTIMVLHSDVVLDGGISLQDGQELIGITGPKKAPPIISNTTGSNGGNGVQVAADNYIDGLHITDTQNSAVFGTDVGNLDILNCLMTQFALSEEIAPPPPPLTPVGMFSRAGVEVSPSDDAKIRISNTELGEANSTAIAILVFDGHADVAIENVSVRDTGFTAGTAGAQGIVVISFGISTVELKVRDTSVSNIGSGTCNCDGMLFLALESSAMNVRVDGYSYFNPDGDGGGSATGLEVGNYFGTGAQFAGVIKNSVIQGPSSVGIQIVDQAPGNSNQLDVQVRNNEIYDAFSGIALDIGFGASQGTTVMTIENNLIVNPANYGIEFLNVIEPQQLVHLLIQRNTVIEAQIGLSFDQWAGGSVGSLILDAGLGGLDSHGHNRIIGSQVADIYVGTFDCCGFPPTPAFTADAAANWWGSSAGPANVIELGGSSVTVIPFLTEDPGEN